jgi:hypothetical protein
MFQRLVISLALVGAAAQGGQVLLNPGFESGSLAPWFTAQGGGSWTITSTNCNSGSFCATATGNFELEQTFAPVDVSTITDISFFVLHPDASVVATAVDLIYQNGNDNEFLVDTSGTGWNFFDVFADLEATGSLTAIGIWGNSGGVTMVDDVSITSSASSVPEPATGALFLAGFAALGYIARRRKA